MSYGAYRSGSSYGGSGGYSSSVGSSYYDNLTSSPMPGRRNMYQGSSSGSAVYAPLHSSPLSSYSSHTNSSPYLYSASPAGSDHSGLYSSSLGSFAQASYGANLTVNTPSIGSAYSSRSSSASSLRSSGRPDSSRYGSRYSEPVTNATDSPQSSRYVGRDRPTSYAGYGSTRSYTGLNDDAMSADYRKLYEQEKVENERLRREVEKLRIELQECRLELERSKLQTDLKPAETRDKRALERKVSELEEEMKNVQSIHEENRKLKEENGALIRVISKLSK